METRTDRICGTRILLAFVAALLLAAAVLVARPATALAETYDVWVGGVQVTSDNADDVLGDGTVSFEYSDEYDQGALYLTDATIPVADKAFEAIDWNDYAGIYSEDMELVIVAYGDNRIELADGLKATSDNDYLNGVCVYDYDLIFVGPGSLSIDIDSTSAEGFKGIYGISADEALQSSIAALTIEVTPTASMNDCRGIYAYGWMSVTDGIIDVRAGDSANRTIAIVVYGLAVSDCATVSATAGAASDSSYAVDGYVSVTDSASLTAIAGSAGALSYGVHGDVLLAGQAALLAYGETVALTEEPNLDNYQLTGALVNSEANPDPTAASPRGGLDPLGGQESVFKLVRLPGYGTIERLAGDYANETSAAIAAEAFPPDSCNWVVIARDDDFADALGATGLAGVMHCPIVLTNRESLSDAAKQTIDNVGATKAYIIGGEGAMKPQLETDLATAGIEQITRVWGENSYDTSLACAQEITRIKGVADTRAIVAMSLNFQDALSVSPIAYSGGIPIVLQTWGDTSADRGFTDEARDYLSEKSIVVVGGPGAISDESLGDLNVYTRLWGDTGYDTSNEIAKWGYGMGIFDPGSMVIACGAQAPKGVDALAGSALAGSMHAPILLVNGNEAIEGVDLTTVDGVLTQEALRVRTTYVLGGTYVMPQDLYDDIAKLVLAQDVTAQG